MLEFIELELTADRWPQVWAKGLLWQHYKLAGLRWGCSPGLCCHLCFSCYTFPAVSFQICHAGQQDCDCANDKALVQRGWRGAETGWVQSQVPILGEAYQRCNPYCVSTRCHRNSLCCNNLLFFDSCLVLGQYVVTPSSHWRWAPALQGTILHCDCLQKRSSLLRRLALRALLSNMGSQTLKWIHCSEGTPLF